MKTYLIYRHGSNAANQSMAPTMAAAIVDANSAEEAKAEALPYITLYANQYLSAVCEDDFDDADYEELQALQDNQACMEQYA